MKTEYNVFNDRRNNLRKTYKAFEKELVISISQISNPKRWIWLGYKGDVLTLA